VLGGEPPETFKYELFLDEKGKKISKKLGNGVSIEQWLKYAPVDSLLYLMFLKPQQAKRMGLPLLPEIVDQHLELVSTWGGDMDSPVPFVSRLSSGPHAETGRKSVPYSMIVDLAMSLGTDDPVMLREYLVKYQPDMAANLAYLDRLIEDALTYAREVLLPHRKAEEPDHELDAALKELAKRLSGLQPAPTGPAAAPDPEALQTLVFQVAKDSGVQPREWFRTLYRIFLGQPQGPRLGSFIALLGVDKAAERIERHLEKAPKA
jgi:lysyl-tRNA synthetase class 1